jgi:hypothetical protein
VGAFYRLGAGAGLAERDAILCAGHTLWVREAIAWQRISVGVASATRHAILVIKCTH